ncbi:hypothetical protein [Marinobacter panjinensis]|nr:hypothetical protein [Marinobacter panjinensis]
MSQIPEPVFIHAFNRAILAGEASRILNAGVQIDSTIMPVTATF